LGSRPGTSSSDRGAPPLAHHLVAARDERIPDELVGRALLVRRLEMIPVECVARGYLAGSGTVDYRRDGAVCGVELPDGLTEASMLGEPIFTPATKAVLGEHDENVSFERVAEQIGSELAGALRDLTLSIYATGAAYAASRGIILADTKLEFGIDRSGALVLGDEVLTPDSSRFWPADGYEPGRAQPSFDKQYVRDWLTSPESGWDRHGDAPPPPLPEPVVEATRARYVEAYTRLTGQGWPPAL
jgi:phosphoribosylaminoimidazole-succinocarboxamide synthase